MIKDLIERMRQKIDNIKEPVMPDYSGETEAGGMQKRRLDYQVDLMEGETRIPDDEIIRVVTDYQDMLIEKSMESQYMQNDTAPDFVKFDEIMKRIIKPDKSVAGISDTPIADSFRVVREDLGLSNEDIMREYRKMYDLIMMDTGGYTRKPITGK